VGRAAAGVRRAPLGMAPTTPTPPPPPGSMTVPPLFGWEFIAVVLLLVVALAVAFFVLSAAGRNVSERAEMQAWLEARSNGRREPASDRGAGPVHRSRLAALGDRGGLDAEHPR
jgi:hypothetical protein